MTEAFQTAEKMDGIGMTGKWKGTILYTEYDCYDDITFVLKKEGASYVGTMTDSMGMANESPIRNVKREAETLSFDVGVYFQGFHTLHNSIKIEGKKLAVRWSAPESSAGGEAIFERLPEVK